jgi:hypothetical protein
MLLVPLLCLYLVYTFIFPRKLLLLFFNLVLHVINWTEIVSKTILLKPSLLFVDRRQRAHFSFACFFLVLIGPPISSSFLPAQ